MIDDINITESDLSLAEYLLDFEQVCQKHLIIKDKKGNLIPFVWNTPQRKLYYDHILPKLLTNKPIRLRILKARQMGFSTLIEAFGFWWTWTNFGQSGAVMAHDESTARKLYDMYRTFYGNLDPALRPQTERANTGEMKFSKLVSSMIVMTAESRHGSGRGGTLQFLHTSETAFYKDAESALTALLQSLADTAHYFDESTANGVGGRFYNDWQLSEEGETDMIPCFFGWYELEEYQIPFETRQERQLFEAQLTQEEKTMQETYNLSLEQLNWRRATIRNKCGNNVKVFMQEYPSNAKEAFLTSGRPVFDLWYCMNEYDRTRKAVTAQFSLIEDKKTGMVSAVEDSSGWWTLLKPVKVNQGEVYRFAVGTDVAEGLEQGDYSAVDVLDRTTMESVIKLHAHCDPDELAYEQYKLHKFLKGSAWFITEVNNHGLTTVINASKLNVPQYYRKAFESGEDVDTGDVGFKTTVSTRPLLLGDLIHVMREKEIKDSDNGYWSEAMTFVRNDKGKMTAQDKDKNPATKCFDDRVFAKALAYHAHQWMPKYQYIKEPEWKRQEKEYVAWAKKNKMKLKQKEKSMASYS